MREASGRVADELQQSGMVPDLDAQRARFPALAGKHYFNYGTQGPLPRAALLAMSEALEDAQRRGPVAPPIFPERLVVEERLRGRFAGLLGVPTDAMALVDATCTGCSIAIQGLAWRPGDHVVLSDAEYPALEYMIRRLEPRFGVTHTVVPLVGHAEEAEARFTAALRPTTRLVLLSHVLWTTGEVVAVEPIARRCRAQGAHLLVDGAQSAGMLALNLEESAISFYAFPGQKHLCGPEGIGGLYVAPFAQPELEPVFAGWRGVVPDAKQRPVGFARGARRYEQATAAFSTRPGMLAALDAHDDFGTPEEREARVVTTARALHEALSRIEGVTMVLPKQPASGLVAFRTKGHTPDALVGLLYERGVYVRSLGATDSVRASIHYLTHESEVRALVEAVAALAHGARSGGS